jgi:hypothetical protein
MKGEHTMKKVDYKKTLKTLYTASAKKAQLVDVPRMNFVMVDGSGDPNTSEQFMQAVEALYGLSYTIKFALKKSGKLDYGVMPLEGLWWCDKMEEFSTEHKELWKWTLMVMQPKAVTEKVVARAREELKKKKNPVLLDAVRFDCYDEGAAAQVLHIGPYAAEAPTIKSLHEFIEAQGHSRRGLHHEIYLGDPQKAAPEKLKTILRQPII